MGAPHHSIAPKLGGQIGVQSFSFFSRVLSVLCFATYLKVRLSRKCFADSLPYGAIVIRDQDGSWHGSYDAVVLL